MPRNPRYYKERPTNLKDPALDQNNPRWPRRDSFRRSIPGMMEEPLTRNEQIHRWIPPAHLALPSSSPDHPTSYSAPSFAVSPTPVPTPFPPQPQMPTPLPTPGMIATPMTTAPTPTTQLPIAPSSFSPPNWPQPQYPYPGNWNQNGCPPVPQNDYSRFPTVPRSPYLNGNYSGDPNIMRVLDEKYGHPGEQQEYQPPNCPPMPNRPMYRNSYPNNYSYGFQQPALGVWTPAQTPAQYPRRVLSDPPEDFKLPSPLSFREFKLDPEAPAFVPAKEKTPPKNTGNGWLIVG